VPRVTGYRGQRAAAAFAAVLTAGFALPHAAADVPPISEPPPLVPRVRETIASVRTADTEEASIWTGLGSLSIGRGFRFNNPYRLATPLGDTAESVSLAATYLDLGLALLLGPRDFRQGASLSGAVALEGIGQFVLTPSYLAQIGVGEAIGLRGRAGIPIVVAPDTTLGLEAGVGSSLDLAYGVGALLELVGSVYFGAATDTTSVTTIPMLSLQVGLFFEHQVSP
jgi:hypothetical protein